MSSSLCKVGCSTPPTCRKKSCSHLYYHSPKTLLQQWHWPFLEVQPPALLHSYSNGTGLPWRCSHLHFSTPENPLDTPAAMALPFPREQAVKVSPCSLGAARLGSPQLPLTRTKTPLPHPHPKKPAVGRGGRMLVTPFTPTSK